MNRPPGTVRAARQARRDAVDAPAKPFRAPSCARCHAPLADRWGNPRWEIVGLLSFICLGGCKPAPSRRSALL